MVPQKTRALVLLSGGMDSAACVVWAKKNFLSVHAIAFDYNQPYKVELKFAAQLSKRLRVPLHTERLPDLNKCNLKIRNKKKSNFEIPGRNGIFLWRAAQFAIANDFSNIVIGTSDRVETESYPDCSAEFMELLEDAIRTATGVHVRIHRPLEDLSKQEIFYYAKKERHLETLKQSISCYFGVTKNFEWGRGCGSCPACIARMKGWNSYLHKVSPQAFPKRFIFDPGSYPNDGETALNILYRRTINHIRKSGCSYAVSALPKESSKPISVRKFEKKFPLPKGWSYVTYAKSMSLRQWTMQLRNKKFPVSNVVIFKSDRENPFLPDLLYGILGQRHWIVDKRCKKTLEKYLDLCEETFKLHPEGTHHSRKVLEKIGSSIFEKLLICSGEPRNKKGNCKILGSHLLTNPSEYLAIKSTQIVELDIFKLVNHRRRHGQPQVFYKVSSLKQVDSQLDSFIKRMRNLI